MIGPRDHESDKRHARLLVLKAMDRLSPRTKAYKLLRDALPLLAPPIGESLKGIFKAAYGSKIERLERE